MNCEYLNSCEMLGTLKTFDKTTIGYIFHIVKNGLCQTDRYKECEVYKLKESLAEKKSKKIFD